MSKQLGEALRWQFTNPKTAKPHFSGKTAIVGHTPQHGGEMLDLGFLKCIDTGCVYGKWLTALEVETGRIWQANVRGEIRKQLGCPPGGPRSSEEPD
jgi:serine/threonine protein phosphatase 1